MKKITVNLPNIPKGSRIYIAGPMRGYSCFNFAHFFYWEEILRNSGYKPINPAKIDACRMAFSDWKFSEDKYEEVIQFDLAIVRRPDVAGLFMLEAWMQSPGALREIAEGRDYSKAICYEVDTELLLS